MKRLTYDMVVDATIKAYDERLLTAQVSLPDSVAWTARHMLIGDKFSVPALNDSYYYGTDKPVRFSPIGAALDEKHIEWLYGYNTRHGILPYDRYAIDAAWSEVFASSADFNNSHRLENQYQSWALSRVRSDPRHRMSDALTKVTRANQFKRMLNINR